MNSRICQTTVCSLMVLVLLGCATEADPTDGAAPRNQQPPTTLAAYIKANGRPTLVAMSAHHEDSRLIIEAAQHLDSEKAMPDASQLQGLTLIYVQNKVAARNLQLLLPLDLLFGTPIDAHTDLLYKMIPPFFFDTKAGEVALVSVDKHGNVRESKLGPIEAVSILGPRQFKEDN